MVRKKNGLIEKGTLVDIVAEVDGKVVAHAELGGEEAIRAMWE